MPSKKKTVPHRIDAARYREIAAWLQARIYDLTAPDLFLTDALQIQDQLILETEIYSYVGAARTLLEHVRDELLGLAGDA